MAYWHETAGAGLPPRGWIDLWPLEPITAPTAQEAKELGLPYLAPLSEGTECHHRFERRPIASLVDKKVKEIHHPTHRALAWIFKHGEERFEVRYFGDLVGCDWETGWRLSVPPVEGLTVPNGHSVYT